MERIDKKLDNKYIIIEKKDIEALADIYLVKEINSENKYLAKIYKKDSKYFEKEV